MGAVYSKEWFFGIWEKVEHFERGQLRGRGGADELKTLRVPEVKGEAAFSTRGGSLSQVLADGGKRSIDNDRSSQMNLRKIDQ